MFRVIWYMLCDLVALSFDGCIAWLLAVIFSEFYRQHSFGFRTFRTITLWFSLTLKSSTSFGEYSISGTTYTKLSQNRRNPRPTGQPLRQLVVQLLGDGPEHKTKQRPNVLHKCHKSRPKGEHQVQLGPLSVTNKSTITRTDLRSNTWPLINMTEQRRAEMCQSQANRPRWGRPA